MATAGLQVIGLRGSGVALYGSVALEFLSWAGRICGVRFSGMRVQGLGNEAEGFRVLKMTVARRPNPEPYLEDQGT